VNRRKADLWASRVILGLVATTIIGFGVGFLRLNAGAFIRPGDIRVDQPAAAVRDARFLIARKTANPEAFGPFTEPEQLPPSLRLDDLHYAKVHTDHIDLVIARNPDVSVGARIWAEHHRNHNDRPTKYPAIFFFRYDNDSPISDSNIQ
jgi:hypothetical protein